LDRLIHRNIFSGLDGGNGTLRARGSLTTPCHQTSSNEFVIEPFGKAPQNCP
jgi:hypothetical protein